MTWNERKFVNDVLAQNVKDVLAQNVNDVMLDRTCAPMASVLTGREAGWRPLYIRPFQGRGTIAPAQWWWVSSPLGCVSIQKHLHGANGILRIFCQTIVGNP